MPRRYVREVSIDNVSRMRIRLLQLFFLLGFLAVAVRLFQIQILQHERYSLAAQSQRLSSTQIPAERGKIFSSDGFLLTTNEPAFLLSADPTLIPEDKIDVAYRVVDLVLSDSRFFSYNLLPSGVSPKTYLRQKFLNLISSDRRWVLLAHKVSGEVKKEIEALGIKGLYFQEEPRRYYPEGALSSSLLGFVAFNEEGYDRGYFGLEGFYNGDLKGIAGEISSEQTTSGEIIPVGGYEIIPPVPGRDLHLTLNRAVQFLLEKKIKEGVERYGAKTGTFIFMESGTGKILAMGNYPSFDPARFLDPSDANPEEVKKEFRNLAVSASYEPGSVMKGVTISSALDSGKITPSTTVNDSGPLQVGGYQINTWDGKHHGVIDVTRVLQLSNNVGAALIAQMMGKDIFRNYLLSFGFGENLGIDVEGEEGGLVKSLKDWKEIDTLTAAFGQGIAITPLQLASAFAVIANGGNLVKPYLVEKIVDARLPDGQGKNEIKLSPQIIRRVISEQTSFLVKDLLRLAVEGGEATRFLSKKYIVAGKTGTAQIPVGGKYDPNLTNATFVGFLYNHPQYLLLVRLEEPKPKIYAAETAVPLWIEMMDEVANYLGIKPDK